MRSLLGQRLLSDERGIALIVALGVMMVFTISVTAAITYSSASGRAAGTSAAQVTARALAEAGLNNAMAVLSKPENHAMQQSTLPSTEATATSASYEGGTAKWWGVLSGTTWTLYGLGLASNPSGPGTDPLRRLLTATVSIQSSLTQELNALAWNYVYATNTGSECDVSFENSGTIDASVFVEGNLCLGNTASIVKANPPDVTNLVVKGNLDLRQPQNTIGTSSARVNEVHVGGSCRYKGGAWKAAPCTSAQNIWANAYYGPAVPGVTPPVLQWDHWFAAALPGPKNFCTTSSGLATTTFDSQAPATAVRDNSAAPFHLTPGTSYTCEYWGGGTLRGRLNWNAATRKLTVAGTIFIDGSVRVANGVVNEYDGQATIYLSGKLTIEGSHLCARVAGSTCDFTSWDPNEEMLIFVANGAGTSVEVQTGSRFQGGLYATNAVRIMNSAEVAGPMVSGTFVFENTIQVHEFPTIKTVPTGVPGNPNVYAQPQPATGFGG